ncbi:MAG: hypothetical protein CMF50_03865 [Legionellales bacterium]|nr:hypothetical protein [Legionellales bacterium]|tara:strand:- start:2417 stop:6520 length:4104 start_codon:yes stop_codon:yes gene_type:complete
MKDFYQILGLQKNATQNEIKKAYRAQSIIAHPDHGGSNESMGLLNEAYEVLSDNTKRRDFDAKLNIFQETDIEDSAALVATEFLPAGPTPRFSEKFRNEHRSLVNTFSIHPLPIKQPSTGVDPQQADFNLTIRINGVIKRKKYRNVYAYISARNSYKLKSQIFQQPAQFDIATITTLFCQFLDGNYCGAELKKITEHIHSCILTIESKNPLAPVIGLFRSVYFIISHAEDKPTDTDKVMAAFEGITSFARLSSDDELQQLIPLLYNRRYRQFVAHIYSTHWRKNRTPYSEQLNELSGLSEGQVLLNVYKEKLSSNDSQSLKRVRWVKLLCLFEKAFSRVMQAADSHNNFREAIFDLLDWVPILNDFAGRDILSNTFLIFGVLFSRAAEVSEDQSCRMADEVLALKMLATAISLANRSTPNVELYINTNAMHCLNRLVYEHQQLNELINAYSKRTLQILDFYPLTILRRSNIAWHSSHDISLALMRRLLNSMMSIYHYNKSCSEPINLEHSAVDLLYQAYEACLKNWYQITYNPAVETSIRLELMEQLLTEQGWGFLDVERNVDTPWVMVQHDDNGWMTPTRSLPLSEDEPYGIYKSIDGFAVNTRTGSIEFYVHPWQRRDPLSMKLFTEFDLQQMVVRNLSGALFSLDPVDPDKPYHPFNQMRYLPSTLYESELLNTMLLTDYFLKFLTTYQEVQAQYPYAGRPVLEMIAHMPEYLRKIITDFREAQSGEEIHRFWIEAEEVNIEYDGDIGDNDTIHMGVKNIRMVVKQHRMERNIHGDLIDTSDQEEGWPIYVLDDDEWEQLLRGERVIHGHAMIFIYADFQLYYWENNQIVYSHEPSDDFEETLVRLFRQEKDESGKLPRSYINYRLLYRTTLTMASESGQPHRYSPEYIFAHEFTEHYDEFSMYLPEFGRLKELAKIASVIRILDNIRKTNNENLVSLKYALSDYEQDSDDIPEYGKALKIRLSVNQSLIADEFEEDRSKFSWNSCKAHWEDIFRKDRERFLSQKEKNIERVIQEIYNDLVQQADGHISNDDIWYDYVIPERPEIMRKISHNLTSSFIDQIRTLYLKISPDSYSGSWLDDEVYSLLDGDIEMISSSFTHAEYKRFIDNMARRYLYIDRTELESAISKTCRESAEYIGKEIARSKLWRKRFRHERLEQAFTDIHFGDQDETIELSRHCFWVPASVRHDVKTDAAGQSRYSFFVYGGVNLQPNISMSKARSVPLSGTRVGSSSFRKTTGGPAAAGGGKGGGRGGGGSGDGGDGNDKKPGRKWTKKARIKAAQLPNEGKIRFVPDDRYQPSEPMRRGPNNGFLDKFGNEWIKGPSRTAGQAFEWDVQLSDLGRKQLGWASRDTLHINVSLDGRITHR